MIGNRFVWTLVAAVLVAGSVSAHAACDAGGVDAAAVTAARDQIDADCPCASAVARSTYRRCATDVVRGLVLSAELETRCRREALKHAKLSTCGRPGAAVCCRVRPDGRTRHRVVSAASRCVSTPTIPACISEWQSVPTGCDGNGCVVMAECGDGVVEGAETCDPPDGGQFCSDTCQAITCDVAPPGCGNGTVDDGETCDPPGVGGCGRDCQPASCAPPGAGEVDVACVDSTTTLGVGARPDGYLLTWSARHLRTTHDLLMRRFDVDGVATDAAATVVSTGQSCATANGDPAVASDGTDYFVVWKANVSNPAGGFGTTLIHGRRINGVAGMALLRTLAAASPIGTCSTGIGAPTMAAGESMRRYAAGWQSFSQCGGSLISQDPVGRIVDTNPSPSEPAVNLSTAAATSGGAVASLATDTLWVWNATVTTPGPYVAAVWTSPSASTSHFVLTSRTATATRRPTVAAGATSFLVAWADTGEIRAVRATRAANAIDPDGGVVLATGVGTVTGGPVAAFDGTRWLVVWAETSGSTNDLRAVAVAQDGTPVDATPRLVATDVAAQDPAVASAGAGKVLVVYARPDGTNRAVRATLVSP